MGIPIDVPNGQAYEELFTYLRTSRSPSLADSAARFEAVISNFPIVPQVLHFAGAADNRPPRPITRVRPIPPFTENLIDVILAGCQNGIDMSHKEGKKAGR